MEKITDFLARVRAERQRKIKRMLAKNPKTKKTDIAKKLGISRTQLYIELARMK